MADAVIDSRRAGWAAR